MPAKDAGAQPGDQHGHGREGRGLESVRQPHRDAQPEVLAQQGPAGPGEPDREALVRAVHVDVPPSHQEHHPVHDERREGAAHRAEPRRAEPAEDERIVERDFQREPDHLQRHHDLGPRHRDVESIGCAEHERRRQRRAQDPQVLPRERRDVGAGPDVSEPQARKCQPRNPDQGQHEPDPEPLHVARADRVVAPGAVVVRDDRVQGAHHADQAHEDAGVDARAEPDGRQVGRRRVPRHHRVEDSVRHRGELAEEDRPGLAHDAEGDGRVAHRGMPRHVARPIGWAKDRRTARRVEAGSGAPRVSRCRAGRPPRECRQLRAAGPRARPYGCRARSGR